MKLYGYFRSSASYRLRIALNLKGIAYENVFIHLRKGEQFGADYVKLNPQAQLPSLEDGGRLLVQSPAILEYLEEAYPEVPLLPKDAAERARVRALAMVHGCDIHPIGNLRVLKYLADPMGLGQDKVEEWFNHWIALGFQGLEAMLGDDPGTGAFCHGDSPTLADVYLAPQVFNSKRFNLPLEPYPTLVRIYETCMAMEAFDKASPPKQPDWE